MNISTKSSALLWGIDDLEKRVQHTLSNPNYTAWWTDLQHLADEALILPIPVLSFEAFREFADHGGREQYQQLYFEKRGRIGALAIISLHTADEGTSYIEALEEALWDICNEYTWCLPAHLPQSNQHAQRPVWEEIDLFAAETAGMLAELSTLFRGRLDDRIIERIESEVQRRIFKPLSEPNPLFSWETADHNWSAVCGSGCGIAALLLLNPDDPRRVQILERMIKAMSHFLSGYGEDGGCAEGLGYWVYGFGYYTYFADMLIRVEPQYEHLLRSTKIAQMAAFPEHLHLSDGVFVNFSDSDEQEILPPGLLSQLGKWTGHEYSLPFQINLLVDDPCRRWAHLIRNLLWSDESYFASYDSVQVDGQEGGVYLPDLNWMICKSNLSKSDITIALATKGGHNDEPHNHNDLGSFIVHAGGENILSDLGAGLYTQAYFASGREQILNISSAGHSVPQIDGQEQQSGREAESHVLEQRIWREGQTDRVIWKLDITKAYAHPTLQQYTRDLDWSVSQDQAEAKLQLIDRFTFNHQPQIEKNRFSAQESSTHSLDQVTPPIVERFMSTIEPIIEADTVRWIGNKAEVCLKLAQAQEKVAVEVIQHVDHHGAAIVLYRTSIQHVASIEQGIQKQSIEQKSITAHSPSLEDISHSEHTITVVIDLSFVITSIPSLA